VVVVWLAVSGPARLTVWPASGSASRLNAWTRMCPSLGSKVPLGGVSSVWEVTGATPPMSGQVTVTVTRL
jgi:hypothetical protein